MALTYSNMIQLGGDAPTFILPNVVDGNDFALVDNKSDKATVIMFICNHCPYVVHLNEKIVEVANTYLQKGVKFIAISSNDVENYPQDSPEKMKELAARLNYPFPYLYDESQEVAKAYDAACTPDFYIFDKALKLAYRGRFDASSPGKNVELTGADLSNALDALLEDNAISTEQKPSMGCNIKWKK